MKFTVEDRENPVEYFENYFDEEIIAFLVTESNRFSHQFKKRIKKFCHHDYDYINDRGNRG